MEKTFHRDNIKRVDVKGKLQRIDHGSHFETVFTFRVPKYFRRLASVGLSAGSQIRLVRVGIQVYMAMNPSNDRYEWVSDYMNTE